MVYKESENKYDEGYQAGLLGKSTALISGQALTGQALLDWEAGYIDGEGDRFQAGRPVDESYADILPAPPGFDYTGEKRVPLPGEYYLTKNGNAKLSEKVRKNNQTRHILRKGYND